MIDTHSHMLPGLDHGCPDLDTSVRMASAAWDVGTTTIVCTPHLYDWDQTLVDEARTVCAEVQAALRERGIDLRLLLGFEVDLNVMVEADESMLALLAIDGSVPGAAPGSGAQGWKGVIVIETPFQGWPPFLPETIFRLKTSGYTPVLAHPERNERVQRSPELVDEIVRSGAVLQGTAGSLSEIFRRGSIRTMHELLARGSLSLLASDAHAFVDYTWTLAPVLEELSTRVPENYLRSLVSLNPERMLNGEPLLPGLSTLEKQAGRSWWRR